SYREYIKTFPEGKFVSIADELIQEDESAGTFTDSRDGNVYKFVTIGNQVWMAENLKYLPVVVKPSTESRTDPHYYVYDYDGTNVNAAKKTDNYSTYGVLYNWPAAMARSASSTANPSKVQGVCPTGWHLPSDVEWTQLIDYLGGDEAAGGKLKETGTAHWDSPNRGATNETGFTALPGGYRNNTGTFNYIGYYGTWWSATENNATDAWNRYMSHNNSAVYRNDNDKEVGFSVRCVRDYATNSKGTGYGTTDSFATYQEDESIGTFTDSTDDGSKGTGYGTTDSFATYQEDESAGTFTDSRDGNVYKFVTIGNQVWMAENLKYLPSFEGPATYYVYGYKGTDVNAAKATANYSTYGVLYYWTTAMAGSTSSIANPSGVQGICPAGWHLPSDAEWTQLIDYLGGDEVAGGKLKESGTAHWKLWERDPNVTEQATNETGFTALPGGELGYTYPFEGIGSYAYWWSASEDATGTVWHRSMDYDYSGVGRGNWYKECGYSVRCVRD
ncbi:MAG TPA: FISUMP domain-containing protein, partial [Oscillospiraceae bacterium]|nr:FISUMP domain-containing protein [Oscillospiraceae bacterium]